MIEKEREQRFIAEQVANGLDGAWYIKGAIRWLRRRDGKVIGEYWAFKSRGRTGAAVRFYMQERLRARLAKLHTPAEDRQTPRKGAPRGSRRGTHKRPQRRAA